MPSKGTAVAFKFTNGVPFVASVVVNGDRGIVVCSRPPDVSSGTDGTSEIEDDGTGEVEELAGEPRMLELDASVSLGTLIGNIELLMLAVAELPGEVA